jgi:hypothetical protein
MNDDATFNLAVQLLLASIRIVNYNINEKDKMRATVKNMLEQFLGINNFFELKTISSDLVYLAED